jgi:hypothetical protein
MPDTYIATMCPSSQTSSATFVEHSSPAYKAGLRAKCRARSSQETYSLFDSDIEGYDIPTASFTSMVSFFSMFSLVVIVLNFLHSIGPTNSERHRHAT